MPAMMHDASGCCKRNGAADGGRRRVPRSGRAAPAPRRWKPLRQGGPQKSGREVAGRPRGRFPPKVVASSRWTTLHWICRYSYHSKVWKYAYRRSYNPLIAKSNSTNEWQGARPEHHRRPTADDTMPVILQEERSGPGERPPTAPPTSRPGTSRRVGRALRAR